MISTKSDLFALVAPLIKGGLRGDHFTYMYLLHFVHAI